VGGATSSVQYSGPTMPEAAAKVIANSASFGCVTIAERHAKKGTEHTSLLRKSELGAKWFISQAIYDTEATIKLLHEYGALCRYKNVAPTKVILTFAPCGRQKTMKFIRWLGVHVPQEVEDRILGKTEEERKARNKEEAVKESVSILCDCLRTILSQTASAGVPLGVSVESVSIFREEIDAAHDLFTQLQSIMLDSHGWPWKVQWVYTMSPTAEERAASVLHARAQALAATSPPPMPVPAPTAAGGSTAPADGAAVPAPTALTQKLHSDHTVHVLLALAVGFLIGAHRP